MATAPTAFKLAVGESSFQSDVLDLSHQLPVVVDFWATWCAPCRQLGPVLTAAVEEHRGALVLRTVDVDANPGLAQRYSIRGIPAVKAFRAGQVAAEFTGAQPAAMVRSFLQRLLPSPAEELVRLGDEASLQRALELDPSNLPARRALGRHWLTSGRPTEAAEVLRAAPHDRICDGLAAWAELDLGGSGLAPDEALAAGDLEAALASVLQSLAASTPPERDQLRRLAIFCFEELGAAHPATVAGRSRLAALLH